MATNAVRRKNPMERIIEIVASGIGNSVGWMAEHGVLFAIFGVIWVGFGAALAVSQGSLDQAWQAIRELPFVVQGLLWLLLLPVMVGLWIWESTWPLVVRLVLVIGVGGWNLLVFLPRAAQSAQP